jgi:hypothetical protein
MKKVKFLLPVVAVVFAVAGVFATGNSGLTLAEVDVTATQSTCPIDGKCSNTGSPNCQINSTGLQFYVRVPGEPSATCAVAATGLFHE